MDCKQVQDILYDLPFGLVEEPVKSQAQAHLAACPECEQAASRCRKALSLFDGWQPKRSGGTARPWVLPSRRATNPRMVLAAGALLGILGTVLAMSLLRPPYEEAPPGMVAEILSGNPAIQGRRISTPAGHEGVVKLFDGSVVQLAPQSQLDVVSWSHVRVVQMTQGFATFKVAKKPELFVVRTAVADVGVLGTTFQLNVQPSAAQVKVIEGVVEVANVLGKERATATETVWVEQNARPSKMPIVERPAAPPQALSADAVSEVLFDDFEGSYLKAGWAADGIRDGDVNGGAVTLFNTHASPNPVPITQIAYQLGEADRIAIEAKWDDFKANPNCSFHIGFGAALGNMLTFGRWSFQDRQVLLLQITDRGQGVMSREIEYPGDHGIFKIEFDASTGLLRAFIKETPEANYVEVAGSPFMHEHFQGPYFAAFVSDNWISGGPSHAKLDWVRISKEIGP